MGLQDKISYHAMRFIQARASEDHALYKTVWNELDASDVDPIEVVDLMASMLTEVWTKDPDFETKIERILEGLRLAIAMDIDDFDDTREPRE
jgi:hypothetical protein